MVESDFSLIKFASIFGAGILLFSTFWAISSGVHLIEDGKNLNGLAAILIGLICFVASVVVYKCYQKKSNANKPGVKSK